MSKAVTTRAGLAVLAVLLLVAFAAGQPDRASAQGPSVDGFVQDPVTGVVESQYVASGITYTQDQATGDFAGVLFTSEDDLGTPSDPSDDVLHFGFSQTALINDNTYEANAIGWGFRRQGHSLKDLLQSEHIEVRLFDVNGVLQLDFFIDYATDADKKGGVIAEPIASTGVGGQDGSMILGDPAAIISAASSLEYNFNVYAGFATLGGREAWLANGCPDPTVTNPERIPANTYDAGTTADGTTPCEWIYELVYEWSVAKSAFPAGFDITDLNSIQILEVHNSPFKTGNPVPVPVITVSRESDPPSGSDVVTGQTITYTVSGTNSGNLALTNVVITDVIDINLENIVPLDGGAYNAGTRTITWPAIASFNPGDTVSVQFTADVIVGTPVDTQIFNTGTFSSPDIAGGSVDTNTTVHNVSGAPLIVLVKTLASK